MIWRVGGDHKTRTMAGNGDRGREGAATLPQAGRDQQNQDGEGPEHVASPRPIGFEEPCWRPASEGLSDHIAYTLLAPRHSPANPALD